LSLTTKSGADTGIVKVHCQISDPLARYGKEDPAPIQADLMNAFQIQVVG